MKRGAETGAGRAMRAARSAARAVAGFLKRTGPLEWYALTVHAMFWYGCFAVANALRNIFVPGDAAWYVGLIYWTVAWTIVNNATPPVKRVMDAGFVRPAAWLAAKGTLGSVTIVLAAVVGATAQDGSHGIFLPAWIVVLVPVAWSLFPAAARRAREDVVRSVLEE